MANMNFGVNILPKANNTYTLGNSDYKWNIFANTINGTSVSTLLSNMITDIQINGTSIISNGIASIPYAQNNSPGVVKLSGSIYLDEENKLRINNASDNDIKTGNSATSYLVPYRQHSTVFYGLAKASGDSTQSASSNAVGIYTDDAKTAIQKMLGIYEPPYELVNDFTLESATNFELTTTDNNIAYNFRNIFMSIDYPANATTIDSGYARYKFYDSNNSANVIAETSRYITNANKKYKYIHVKRESNFTIAYYTVQENTGSAGYWRTKSFGNGSGVSTNLGNITKITMPEGDSEPIGTRIRVYAQWAY